MKSSNPINQAFADAEKFMALEESYLDHSDVSPEEARVLARLKRKNHHPFRALKGYLLNLLF